MEEIQESGRKTAEYLIKQGLKAVLQDMPSNEMVSTVLTALKLKPKDIPNENQKYQIYSFLAEPFIEKIVIKLYSNGRKKELDRTYMYSMLNEEEEPQKKEEAEVEEEEDENFYLITEYQYNDPITSENLTSKEKREYKDIYGKSLVTLGEKFSEWSSGEPMNIALYNELPSMETARVNYDIEKEIYQSKPINVEGMYKCRKCNSMKTITFEVQLRSADEPMNVYINCLDCRQKSRIS